MSRIGWIFCVVTMLCIAGGVRYLFNDSETVTAAGDYPQSAAVAETKETVNWSNESIDTPPIIAEKNTASSEPEQLFESDKIISLVVTTDSPNSNERDASNDALIKLPRERILPVLQHLVMNGGEGERSVALNALHMLALKRGDEAGEIQNILRLTSYDGDDALASHAQLALEDIQRETTSIR